MAHSKENYQWNLESERVKTNHFTWDGPATGSVEWKEGVRVLCTVDLEEPGTLRLSDVISSSSLLSRTWIKSPFTIPRSLRSTESFSKISFPFRLRLKLFSLKISTRIRNYWIFKTNKKKDNAVHLCRHYLKPNFLWTAWRQWLKVIASPDNSSTSLRLFKTALSFISIKCNQISRKIVQNLLSHVGSHLEFWRAWICG